MSKHNNRIVKIMNQQSYQTASSIGAASGSGSRSRTMLSGRDKANCPKRQRKNQNWKNDWR